MTDTHTHSPHDGVSSLAQSGREKVAESSDPYLATAVRLVTPGHDGMAAMARAIVEEFALLGWSRRRLMSIFTTANFAGAHAVYLERGEAYVEQLITDVIGAPEEEATDG